MATNTITIKYDYESALKDVINKLCTVENKDLIKISLMDKKHIKTL
jgi:hypothetical protein